MEDENENKDIDLEISMFDFLKGRTGRFRFL